MTRTWLFKSEPDEFSLADLAASPGGTARWDGVRNYQARNLLRDEVRRQDRVLFYHSSCAVPAIVGLARVVAEAYPDPTALDPASAYHDPKSRPGDSRWVAVDVQFVRAFDRPLERATLAAHPVLRHMLVMRRGMRLSIQPVSAQEWRAISALADADRRRRARSG